MPTVLDKLKEALARHEAEYGPDAPFSKALRLQIANAEQGKEPQMER